MQKMLCLTDRRPHPHSALFVLTAAAPGKPSEWIRAKEPDAAQRVWSFQTMAEGHRIMEGYGGEVMPLVHVFPPDGKTARTR